LASGGWFEAEGRNAGRAWYSAGLIGCGASALCVGVVMRAVGALRRPWRWVHGGGATLAAGVALTGAPAPYAILVGLALCGAGLFACVTAATVLMAGAVEAEQHGLLFGIVFAAQQGAETAAPLGAGLAADSGANVLAALAGAAALVAGLTWIAVRVRHRPGLGLARRADAPSNAGFAGGQT